MPLVVHFVDLFNLARQITRLLLQRSHLYAPAAGRLETHWHARRENCFEAVAMANYCPVVQVYHPTIER
jgi:hypothetical protein